ncbi:MAG: phosphatase PAP2 family protein [Terriglobales bacterium]
MASFAGFAAPVAAGQDVAGLADKPGQSILISSPDDVLGVAAPSSSTPSEQVAIPVPPAGAAAVMEGVLPACPTTDACETAARTVSWKRLVPNLLQDQKEVWTYPVHAVENRQWLPVAGVAAVTAGLLALDPVAAQYFRNTGAYHGFNQVFSSNNTQFGTAAVPVALYAASLIRRNKYGQHTFLFAGEAVLDSEILTQVLKGTTLRLRPIQVPENGNFSNTFFENKFSILNIGGSFPSGHTVGAFSVATVYADRYRAHRWVPWVAYGLASTVGFSRLTLQAHFTSDVFVGAVLGYSISHFIVLRHKAIFPRM